MKSGTPSEESTKTEIKKGALYKFDDGFRERAEKCYNAQMDFSVSAHVMKTRLVCQQGFHTLTNGESYENGFAVLGAVTIHCAPKEDSKDDICQILFNNKNGVRYLYRDELELAEKVSK